MQTFIKNIKFLILTLFITTVGYSQSKQNVVDTVYISPPEMKSTSAIVVHFKEKGNYIFQIIKNEEIIFSKDILKVKQISFKIDFSEYEFGQYRMIIMDKRNNLFYDKIHIKK